LVFFKGIDVAMEMRSTFSHSWSLDLLSEFVSLCKVAIQYQFRKNYTMLTLDCSDDKNGENLQLWKINNWKYLVEL